MDIDIEWQEPIQLTRFKKIIVDEKKLPEEIENSGGVYFFSRKYGDTYEPFYIGETGKLKTRLGQHLKSKQLADVLRGINDSGKIIKAGDRFFHFGYFIAKGGQDGGKCRKIVQKFLVMEALSQDITLLNVQLTARKTHAITFSGTKKARAIYGKKAKVEI